MWVKLMLLGAVASMISTAQGRENPASQNMYVPISIQFPGYNSNPVPGETAYNIREAVVTMCNIDWAAYKSDPSAIPMFRDLMIYSGCLTSRANTFTTTFGELEGEFTRRGCSPAGNHREWAPGCVPSGMVFHESRCGSTLAANMMAALPYTLVYSEPPLPADILYEPYLSKGDKVHMLRVIVAAMGRRIPASLPLLGGGSEIQSANTGNTAQNTDNGASSSQEGVVPRQLYIKFQSSTVLKMDVLRAAFPSTPWIFLHRQPVEVLSSLLRNAKAIPDPDGASTLQFVAPEDPGVRDAPCMRSRGPETAPAFVLAALGIANPADVLRSTAEDYCAASLAQLCATALREAARARRQVFVNIFHDDEATMAALRGAEAWDGYTQLRLLRSNAAIKRMSDVGVTIDFADGMLYNKTGRSGAVTRVGLGFLLDYADMPDTFIKAMQLHMSPRRVTVKVAAPSGGTQERRIDDYIGTAEIDLMRQAAVKYSKARGRVALPGGKVTAAKAGVRQSKPLRGPSLDEHGDFIPDEEIKQSRAWPALKSAANKYLSSLRTYLMAFSLKNEVELRQAVEALDPAVHPITAAQMEEATIKTSRGNLLIPGPLARHLPIGAGYPHVYPLNDILTDWNPDIVTIPDHYGRYQSLRTFDYLTELEEAEEYRRAERPFVIRNLPGMEEVLKDWADDKTLADVMGQHVKYAADVNDNTHFMFFQKTKGRQDRNFKAPTKESAVTYAEWAARAHEVAAAVMKEEGYLPATSWAAPPSLQKPSTGLNSDPDEFRKGKEPYPLYRSDVVLDLMRSLKAPKPVERPVMPKREQRTLWYMRASTSVRSKEENAWLHPYFPIFDTDKPSFTMVEPESHRGIHCRYGMPGIIAESHYDAGRNFVFMVRGRKRYIMSPPSECNNLHMLKSGPSARHSMLDWTHAQHIQMLRNASAFEVVLEPGEALYIPAFWFHFIVSLTVNIQCNSRSGTPPHGAQDIADCGFDARFTEPVGAHTSEMPPLRHLVALAQSKDSYKPTAILQGRALLQLAEATAWTVMDAPAPLFDETASQATSQLPLGLAELEEPSDVPADAVVSTDALHLKHSDAATSILTVSSSSLAENSIAVAAVALFVCIAIVSSAYIRRCVSKKKQGLLKNHSKNIDIEAAYKNVTVGGFSRGARRR